MHTFQSVPIKYDKSHHFASIIPCNKNHFSLRIPNSNNHITNIDNKIKKQENNTTPQYGSKIKKYFTNRKESKKINNNKSHRLIKHTAVLV